MCEGRHQEPLGAMCSCRLWPENACCPANRITDSGKEVHVYICPMMVNDQECGDLRVSLNVTNKPEASSSPTPSRRIHLFDSYFIWEIFSSENLSQFMHVCMYDAYVTCSRV